MLYLRYTQIGQNIYEVKRQDTKIAEVVFDQHGEGRLIPLPSYVYSLEDLESIIRCIREERPNVRFGPSLRPDIPYHNGRG